MIKLLKKIVNKVLFKVFTKQIKLLNTEQKAAIFLDLSNASLESIYTAYRNKYKIDSSFRFNGKDIMFYGDGQIICGSNSYIGNYSTIQANKNNKVTIGNNCSISHNVRIYTLSSIANQDMNCDSLKLTYSKDVVIGNGVWIGANVFINPGVIIGDNAVIGANSVITKNIDANTIVGGVPAKLIKQKSY